uniref:Aprataxin and PNKP like factor n=1 Tax=Kryptolebias marmoratus TaxID=37003 RepID=A0A3Q2ZXE3_KRYMA
MSGFDLVPVDGGDPVHLPPGETVLGRGPLLDVSDTRVSRHHGLLENLNGRLRLKPTHVNPCFVLSSPSDDPRPLERGSWFQLRHGDLFSLLPGRFIYRVEATPRYCCLKRFHGDVDNYCDDSGRRGRRVDDVQSAVRRRVLPAWMMGAPVPKSLASSPKGSQQTVLKVFFFKSNPDPEVRFQQRSLGNRGSVKNSLRSFCIRSHDFLWFSFRSVSCEEESTTCSGSRHAGHAHLQLLTRGGGA